MRGFLVLGPRCIAPAAPAIVTALIQIDFPGLAMTLSCTRTSCSSVRRERFHLGDFTVKTEVVVSNFVTI